MQSPVLSRHPQFNLVIRSPVQS